MFGVYCSRQDSRENYKHSVGLHGAARIGQSWVESQWREAYVIMSSKWAPISRLREPLPTGVWMHRWMGSRVKVLCGVCPQPIAACISRTLRVSRKPFDMLPRIIQAHTELWFYLLLPSTRFTQPLPPRSFNVPPSVSPDIRLFTELWCRQQFCCAGQVEAVSCTAGTVILHWCCIEKCKCRGLFAFCLFWQLTRATKPGFRTLRSEGMY